MRYQIQTTNEQEHLALMQALYKLGYRYHGTCLTPEEAHRQYKQWPVTVLNPPTLYMSGNQLLEASKTSMTTVDAAVFIGVLKPVEARVRLNDEYEAVVTADGVTVGCQTFPLEKIQELNEAVKKVTVKP